MDPHDQATHTLIASGRWCEQRVQCVCTDGTPKTIICACLCGHSGATNDTQIARQNEALHAAAQLRIAKYHNRNAILSMY